MWALAGLGPAAAILKQRHRASDTAQTLHRSSKAAVLKAHIAPSSALKVMLFVLPRRDCSIAYEYASHRDVAAHVVARKGVGAFVYLNSGGLPTAMCSRTFPSSRGIRPDRRCFPVLCVKHEVQPVEETCHRPDLFSGTYSTSNLSESGCGGLEGCAYQLGTL
jgi:hypothetical protein